MSSENPMANLKLGQVTEYPNQYDAALLQPVPRQLNRSSIGINNDALPFVGSDLWTCYELSWLQPNGVPAVAIAEIEVPITSLNLIESKSFKLYLNGYNQSVFANRNAVANALQHDLSACAGAPVQVRIYSLDEYTAHGLSALPGECIDHEPVTITEYDYNSALLANLLSNSSKNSNSSDSIVTEVLYSHLLKSNCLITNQPDWGSVYIAYTGPKIDRQALLQYLVSFRNHNEFHEQCVERIYSDLHAAAQCEHLTVLARYTRRGGLDINPIRSNAQANIDTTLLRNRLARQ